MPTFASARERRLWLWTLLVVVTIYATLGLTGALAEELRDRGLSTAGFVLAMLLVGVTVLTQGLRRARAASRSPSRSV